MNSRGYKVALRSVLLGYMLILIICPIAAVYVKGFSAGWEPFWHEVTDAVAWKAVWLTVKLSIVTTLIQALLGTWIAFVLVRYDFPGKSLLNSLVDLPFALPTAVAGIMLLALLGPGSQIGAWLEHRHIKLLYNEVSIVIGMVFVTFPFVIRTVQPLLEQLDPAEEQASYTLGAGKSFTFFKVILPAMASSISAGSMLAFTRALAEFGAISIISGNIPGKTMVISVFIYGETQNYRPESAAALSILMLTLSLILLWGMNAVQRRKERAV